MHSAKELELEVLRQKIESLNWEFFNTLSVRREFVHKAQVLKGPEHALLPRFPFYDWQREVQLFKKLESVLITFSLKQLLIFSLVIEEQANPQTDGASLYPEWSKGIHLDGPLKGIKLEHQINPLILYYKDKKLARSLSLTEEFSFLKQFIAID